MRSQAPPALPAGDQEARSNLVLANLRLAASLARRYARLGVPLDDLIQEANMALVEAVGLYDPSLGTQLSTYATFRIRYALIIGVTRERVRQLLGRSLDRLRGQSRLRARLHDHYLAA